PPTSTPSLNEMALDQALAQIQSLMDAGRWEEAIAQLRELSELDPGYQAGLIEQMLFNAHYNLALAYEQAGDIDGMLRELDEALKLRPGNTAANQLKKTLDLYRIGQENMGKDWEAAIAAFTELFALDPDFQDTPDQLFLAYAGYGDSLRRTDPCAALERYRLALQLKRDPQVRAKLEDARIRCGPPDNIAGSENPTAPALGGPTPTAVGGRIAYTYFDEERTYHRTRFWDIASSTPAALIADESLQPDVGPNGWILVRSTNAERYGITMFETVGGPPRRLTKEAGDTLPRWSPDGSFVLFTSTSRTEDRTSHIFILELQTGKLQDWGEGVGPDWAPDGTRIVYHGCNQDGEQCGLWILNLTTGERRQLTSNPGDTMPTWSPDGRLIAFMSDGRSPGWDIFIADAENGNIPYFALDDADDGLPIWSPDGQHIAFLSNREGDWAVYVWALDDLSVQRLFPVEGSLPAWQEAGMAWAP
ncbi:MAG: hypothetical protein D6775_14495, partial [Caldilineae bacterium]